MVFGVKVEIEGSKRHRAVGIVMSDPSPPHGAGFPGVLGVTPLCGGY